MNTCAAELTDGGYRVDYVADQPLTPTHQGLPLVANTTWPALEPHDLVVVPGWKTQVVPDPLNQRPDARPCRGALGLRRARREHLRRCAAAGPGRDP